MTTKEVHSTKFTVRVLSTKIFEIRVHENVTIEAEDIKDIKKINMQLSQGKPYATIVEAGMFSGITKEARVLAASREFSQTTIAKALLVHSLAQRLVCRFYITVNKPHIKTRIFSEREKAVEWLEKQVNKKLLVFIPK